MNYRNALKHCPDHVLNVLLELAVKKQKYEQWGLQSLAKDIQDTIDQILRFCTPTPEPFRVRSLAELMRDLQEAV